jgi:NTP pyrophosphatase (non-canonical NTP hydrolase)
MSEMEFRVGRAIEVCKDQETFDEKVKELAIRTGLTIEDLTDDYNAGCQQMKYRGDYIYAKGRMFQLIDDANIEEEYDCREIIKKDGQYHYKLRYYNGGACFEEMFEEALEAYEENPREELTDDVKQEIVDMLDDIINYLGGSDSDTEEYIREIRKGYES